MSLVENELLYPLRRFRPSLEATFEQVAPEQMPEALRGLLVHTGDMTSRLEDLHQTRIALDVLQAGVGDGGAYYREVLLKNESTGSAVEYGAIEILLDGFDLPLRGQILEGKIPLGGLLNSNGVRYRSEPQAYFRVSEGAGMHVLLGVAADSVLYGRCNILRAEAGALFARIVEVLPPVVQRSAFEGGQKR
jgi:chorismate-pyruvate lyase